MVPNKVELLCRRAQQAMAARDWEKARQFYLLALDFRAGNPEVHYGLATVCFQLRDMTNAAYHFHEVTRLEPTRARAYIQLGATLHQLGELEDAETALCKGLQIDGQLAEGYYLLGLVHKARGRFDWALIAFTEALRCNPRLADALLGMGEVHVLNIHPEKALPCYEEALRLRPNWEKAIAGRQAVQAVLSRGSASKPPEGTEEGSPGLARRVDPDTDGLLLAELNQVARFLEQKGETLHKILGEQLSPLLVELSRLLVNPKSLRSDLGTCLTQFESALERLHAARQGLEADARKIEEFARQFPSK
jgi:tetratricopeptide (TPR) repeat protein